MKILILGAGKMGSFFTDLLSFDHEVAVYEIDASKLRFMYNTQRFTSLEEIKMFSPELVINAVSLKFTLTVFDQVAPYLPKGCILSDISSVKTGFKEYYEKTGFRYVSTHPMFGPTFANLGKLTDENAIIINEGDYMGRVFFRDLYSKLGLRVHEYTFEEHDQTVAYSLSIPFISTFAFAAVMLCCTTIPIIIPPLITPVAWASPHPCRCFVNKNIYNNPNSPRLVMRCIIL